MTNRPMSPAAVAAATWTAQPAQDVPAWHDQARGSAELGEFNSAHHGVPATAEQALDIDGDGARFPAVLCSMWGYRGHGEPYISLDLGGVSAEGAQGVRLRLVEAQQLARHLQRLVDAGLAGGAL
ncbi:hypothetical protein [Kineococcus terrestris]|uniref:hypothetical protein n=1 Tax=Kineococcus terrestris TaxID=2044856 RepID=UPI0034DB2A44